MAFSVDLSGDVELIAALKKLERKEVNKAVQRGQRGAAKLNLNAAKQRLVSNGSVKTGKLLRSLRVKAGRRSRQGPSMIVIAEMRGETFAGSQAEKGFVGDVFYGAFIEFGFTHRSGKEIPAKPFLRPAFDENLQAAEAIIREEVGAYIEREWAKGRFGDRRSVEGATRAVRPRGVLPEFSGAGRFFEGVIHE